TTLCAGLTSNIPSSFPPGLTAGTQPSAPTTTNTIPKITAICFSDMLTPPRAFSFRLVTVPPAVIGYGSARAAGCSREERSVRVPAILRRLEERANEGSRRRRISAKIHVDSRYSTIDRGRLAPLGRGLT